MHFVRYPRERLDISNAGVAMLGKSLLQMSFVKGSTQFLAGSLLGSWWSIAIILEILFAGSSALYEQTEWQDGVGDWFLAANCTNGRPTAAIDATVNNGGTAQIGAA